MSSNSSDISAMNTSDSAMNTSTPHSNIIEGSYLVAIILISISGNLAVIIGIIQKRLLDNVTNCFILNLCISDLLNASLKMTSTVAGLFDRNWYPSYAFCYFITPFGVLFGAASVLSMSSVAFARYLMIAMPFTYASKVTPSVAKFVLIGVWLGSVFLSFPPVTWRPVDVICQSGAVSDAYYTSELIYMVFLWLFVIVFPSVIMATSYIRIFGVTSYQIRRMSITNPGSLERRQNLRRRREVRAAVVLALIGGIFIVCWFPFFVILTVHKFASEKKDPMYFKVFLCWMYTNSALNPILLILFNSEIRTAVQRVFPCLNHLVKPNLESSSCRETSI